MAETLLNLSAVREAIDDEILTRTGRSLGDIASGWVALAAMQAVVAAGWRSPDEVARLVADAEQRAVELGRELDREANAAERECEQLRALLREVRHASTGTDRCFYAPEIVDLIDNAGIDLGGI